MNITTRDPRDATSQHDQAIRDILLRPSGGIVGLVDELLATCHERRLHVNLRSDSFRVRTEGGAWEELTDVPLRKSVIRAVLARIAALCNERMPNSVSPYGGRGELASSSAPSVVFQVTFANTPTEQTFELWPAAPLA